MNGRQAHSPTAAERIAAVVRTLMVEMMPSHSHGVPDYADIRDRITPYLEVEKLIVQMEFAKGLLGPEAQHIGRKMHLAQIVLDLQAEITTKSAALREDEHERTDAAVKKQFDKLKRNN